MKKILIYLFLFDSLLTLNPSHSKADTSKSIMSILENSPLFWASTTLIFGIISLYSFNESWKHRNDWRIYLARAGNNILIPTGADTGHFDRELAKYALITSAAAATAGVASLSAAVVSSYGFYNLIQYSKAIQQAKS